MSLARVCRSRGAEELGAAQGLRGDCRCQQILHRCFNTNSRERAFFVDNLLVQIRCIIELIWWTGLAPWEYEFPFLGSLISSFSFTCAGAEVLKSMELRNVFGGLANAAFDPCYHQVEREREMRMSE